jgi:hypothetical protein
MWLTLLLAQTPGSVDENMEPAELKSVDELVRELRSEDRADSLYAARELKAQAKGFNKTLRRGQPGSIRVLEARQQLAVIEERAAGPCIDFLVDERLAAPCAGLLMELELTAALPALYAAAEQELPRRSNRAILRAIDALEAE